MKHLNTSDKLNIVITVQERKEISLSKLKLQLYYNVKEALKSVWLQCFTKHNKLAISSDRLKRDFLFFFCFQMAA